MSTGDNTPIYDVSVDGSQLALKLGAKVNCFLSGCEHHNSLGEDASDFDCVG
jgi:hypothetical protein